MLPNSATISEQNLNNFTVWTCLHFYKKVLLSDGKNKHGASICKISIAENTYPEEVGNNQPFHNEVTHKCKS